MAAQPDICYLRLLASNVELKTAQMATEKRLGNKLSTPTPTNKARIRLWQGVHFLEVLSYFPEADTLP
jgi:hypothetical protein